MSERTVVLPPPAPELVAGDEFKKQENEFLSSYFDPAPRRKGEDAQPPATPPAETPPAAEKKEETPATPSTEKKELEGLAPEGEPVEPAPAAPETPAVPAPTQTPALAPAAQPAIDPGDIADRVIEGLRQPAPAAPAAPENPYAKFSEADQKQLRVIEHLQKINPRYPGIVSKAVDFYSREAVYKEHWLRNNPGKQYRAKDEEHAEFYEANEPQIDVDDLDEAKIDLRVQERLPKAIETAVNERVAPIEERARQTERVTLEAQVQPEIHKGINGAVVEFVKEAVPEFKEFLPNGRLTGDALKKMAEADPEAVDVINQEAALLKERVRECEAMVQMGEHYNWNEAKIVDTKFGSVAPCQEINRALHELEKQWLKKPAAEQKRGDQQFLPQWKMREYLEKAGENERLKAALYRKFFTLDIEDIRKEFVRQSAEKVRSTLSVAKKRAERVSKKIDPKQETPPSANPAATTVKSGSNPPPSTPASSDSVDTRIPAAPGDVNSEKTFEKSFFS